METNNNFAGNRSSNMFIGMVLIFVLIIAAVLGFLFFGDSFKPKVAADSAAYQAVFLNNGQVYFGKLEDSGRWLKLTDVYYLQVNGELQKAASDQTTVNTNGQQEIKLVKLGSELHGPEDAMYIDRSNVAFWENMKSDSKVMEAINKNKAK